MTKTTASETCLKTLLINNTSSSIVYPGMAGEWAKKEDNQAFQMSPSGSVI